MPFGETERVPEDGALTRPNVSASPSTSLPISFPLTTASSMPRIFVVSASGASFTGATSILTAAVAWFPSSS